MNVDKETKTIEEKQVLFDIKSIHDLESDDFIGSFSALAATFGNIDLTDDVIEKGAFSKVIKKIKKTGEMPKALIQHFFGDTGAVFTDIKETDEGLLVDGKFINTTRGRDLRVEVKTGAINRMSIAFIPGRVDFDRKKRIRIIKEIDELPEISFVTFPANPKAKVIDAKSKPNSIRDVEKLLKENGFSQKEAKAIVSCGYKAINQCDADKSHREDVKSINDSLDKLNYILKGE